MFQQVTMHLKNLQGFKKLGIDYFGLFRLVDRDLIFQGFKTDIKYDEQNSHYTYSFWKREDKTDLYDMNFLYFDRSAALYIRRVMVLYKEKFENK